MRAVILDFPDGPRKRVQAAARAGRSQRLHAAAEELFDTVIALCKYELETHLADPTRDPHAPTPPVIAKALRLLSRVDKA